jgi:hypothetical protein
MNVLAVEWADVNYGELTDPIVGAPSYLTILSIFSFSE